LIRRTFRCERSCNSFASSEGHSPTMNSVMVRVRIVDEGIALMKSRLLIAPMVPVPWWRLTRRDWKRPEEIHLARMVLLQEDKLLREASDLEELLSTVYFTIERNNSNGNPDRQSLPAGGLRVLRLGGGWLRRVADSSITNPPFRRLRCPQTWGKSRRVWNKTSYEC